MKRKDDAEERKKTEFEQQKSVDRTHWTLEDKNGSSSAAKTGDKVELIVEYDNSAYIEGDIIGRQSFRNFNKEPVINDADTLSTPKLKSDNKTKIPKLDKANSNKKK